MGYNPRVKVCNVCGKEFISAPGHKYRHGGKWQCCYTCYRVLQKPKGLTGDSLAKCKNCGYIHEGSYCPECGTHRKG